MENLKINCQTAYNVLVGEKIVFKLGKILKEKLPNCFRVVVLTDSLVKKLYGEFIEKILKKSGFLVFVFVLPNKEKSKNFKNVLKFYSFLFKCKISKKDLIVSLGGGMVLDFGGFCAATYLRGINLVNLPTTLLSQVDASVGGKNAINLKFGKNLVGTIRSPFLVVCDVFFLKTLSKRVFNSGVSEIIKYAATFSKELFNILENKNIFNCLEEVVSFCVKIKKDVVEKDEFEKNNRMKLNFGHTIGHALEKIYNYKIQHGEAVSIGMNYITEKSFKAKMTNYDDFLKLQLLLKKYSLPTTTKAPFKKLFKHILADKKIFANKINVCIIKKIGCCEIVSFSLLKFKKFLQG